MSDIQVGDLIRLTIDGSAKTITNRIIALTKNDIGLILAKNIHPGDRWSDINNMKRNGPFAKILFRNNIVVIPMENLFTRYFIKLLFSKI